MFDVEERECLGHYMYGAGFYAREDRDAIARDPRPRTTYCDRCESRPECWEGLKRRVKLKDHAAVARFEAKLKEGARFGIKPGLVAAKLAKEGQPDPYMLDLLANFKRGEQDREENRNG